MLRLRCCILTQLLSSSSASPVSPLRGRCPLHFPRLDLAAGCSATAWCPKQRLRPLPAPIPRCGFFLELLGACFDGGAVAGVLVHDEEVEQLEDALEETPARHGRTDRLIEQAAPGCIKPRGEEAQALLEEAVSIGEESARVAREVGALVPVVLEEASGNGE
ncbi:hypothetical protein VPH35_118779 [Triticum aestivum]